jgi:hypothetical protein
MLSGNKDDEALKSDHTRSLRRVQRIKSLYDSMSAPLHFSILFSGSVIISKYISGVTIPVAARSKAWVCGLSIVGIVGSNPAVGHGCLCVVSVVCCQVEVSATGWSLVQRSPTECGVSEGDREVSIMRSRTTRGCCAFGKKKIDQGWSANRAWRATF